MITALLVLLLVVCVGSLWIMHLLCNRIDELRAERDRTVEWLTSRGHQVAPSDANFVLFGRFPDRHAVWTALLDRGVLIRETGPDGWLRVSAGTPGEMSAFKAALTAVLDALHEQEERP